MEEKERLRIPYASSGKADAILDLFKRIVPKKIDNKFVVENKIATSNNAFTVTDLVKWLGITDADGNVDTEIMSKLKLVGDERDNFIKGLVENSYKDLLDKVNLVEAKKEDVINYFVHYHQLGTATAKFAASLFLHLCHKYNIPVSEGLKKQTHTGTGKRIQGIKRNQIRKTKENAQEKESDGGFNKERMPNKGEVLIEIKGQNGLYFPLTAKSKKELDEIVNTKIKTIVNAIKLTLPDNHEDKSDEGEEPDLS